MDKEEYELFKKMWLLKFRKYYRSSYSNKKELKRSIYENFKLSDEQKEDFWNLVIEKDVIEE